MQSSKQGYYIKMQALVAGLQYSFGIAEKEPKVYLSKSQNYLLNVDYENSVANTMNWCIFWLRSEVRTQNDLFLNLAFQLQLKVRRTIPTQIQGSQWA